MKSYTTPDGKNSLMWPGDIETKIKFLAELGITYTPTQNELDEQANIQNLKSEFISTIDTLNTIETANSPSNAQVIAAVKFLAKTLRLLLKLLRNNYH